MFDGIYEIKGGACEWVCKIFESREILSGFLLLKKMLFLKVGKFSFLSWIILNLGLLKKFLIEQISF